MKVGKFVVLKLFWWISVVWFGFVEGWEIELCGIYFVWEIWSYMEIFFLE